MVQFPKTTGKKTPATGNYDSWDRFGRTVKQKWTKYNTSNVRDEINYTYDYAGNRTSREDVAAATNSVDIDQTYDYDALHRLKSFKEGDLVAGTITTVEKEKDWTLDPLGNWGTFVEKAAGTTTLNQTRTHNKANELGAITASTGTNWADGACDAAGNMKTIPKPNDLANGYTATYDAWNRLVKIVDASTSTTVAEYEYDGLNQRIQKVVGADTYDYYYNMKWQAVVEFKNGAANRLNLFSAEYIDALAVSVTATDRHFYTHDANYNVTSAITPSASTAERYSYSPYGKVTVRDADFSTDADGKSDIGNEFLFTGRRLDTETGFYYFRLRYYEWHIGRFITQDPIRYHGGGSNLYAGYFVPNGVDPLGLVKTSINFKWGVAKQEIRGFGFHQWRYNGLNPSLYRWRFETSLENNKVVKKNGEIYFLGAPVSKGKFQRRSAYWFAENKWLSGGDVDTTAPLVELWKPFGVSVHGPQDTVLGPRGTSDEHSGGKKRCVHCWISMRTVAVEDQETRIPAGAIPIVNLVAIGIDVLPGGSATAEFLENTLSASGVVGGVVNGHMTFTSVKTVDFVQIICADGKRMVGVYKIPKERTYRAALDNPWTLHERAEIESSPGGASNPRLPPASTGNSVVNWIKWD